MPNLGCLSVSSGEKSIQTEHCCCPLRHLISKTLLEESLRALFNHGWQWKLTGSDNSSSRLEFPDSFPAAIEQLVFIYFSESEISVVNCGMHSLACPSGINLMAL